MASHLNEYGNATQGVVRRLFLIAGLLQTRRYGLTRLQIYAELPEEYAGSDAAKERMFHRDMALLRELDRVHVVNPEGTGGGTEAVYLAPEHAHYRNEEVDG